ncbi:MAG: hypothetical protein J5865_00505 [Lachnospiraceae bacterium]|nr:hypothetical protein [Lachnospiraceae bacterium]
MFCGNCGYRIDDGMDRCPNCGMPVASQPGPAAASHGQGIYVLEQEQPWQPEQAPSYGQPGPVFEQMGPSYERPVQAYEQPGRQEPSTDAKGRKLRSRGFAIWALICAVLSALICFFPFVSLPLALLGLILGILGRRSEERSMAGVALVIAIIFLIWNVTVVVIAMIHMKKYGFDLDHIQYFVEQFFRNFFN